MTAPNSPLSNSNSFMALARLNKTATDAKERRMLGNTRPMNQIRKRLSKTNRRIRECNDRINLYHWRAVDRAKNPLAAQQAEQLLPLALDHLRQLHIHRRRLEQALEMDSPHEPEIPTAPPLLPRLMR